MTKEEAQGLAQGFRETADQFDKSADQMRKLADQIAETHDLETSATQLKKPSNIVVPMSKRVS